MPRQNGPKYEAVPLEERLTPDDGSQLKEVVIHNPAKQLQGGTSHNPRSAAPQTTANEGQPSTSNQRPSKNKRQNTITEQPTNNHKRESISDEQPVNVGTELHLACQRLDSERVSFLLEQGSDANALEERWLTPLDVVGENIPPNHNSPIESLLRVIKALLKNDGKPTSDEKAKYPQTPLHVAVNLACGECEGCDNCSQCLAAIDILVEAGYNELLKKGIWEFNKNREPKPTDKEVYSVLHAAIQKKWLGGAKALLRHGADVNDTLWVVVHKRNGKVDKHRRGENVLHVAVHNEWLEGVTLLIEHGAKVNAKLSAYAGGYTPLHMASQRLDVSCLELLLEADADPNALDEQGLTPLDVVGEKHRTKTVERFLGVINALIAKEGRPTSNDNPKYRQTPIHVAVEFESLEAIRILYNNGYKKLLANKSGNTPLHMVASQRSEEYFNVLVSYYKNTGLDSRNKLGETALHVAVRNMWIEGVKTLLVNGADITIKTLKKKTVLHLLPQKRNYIMMSQLLDHKDKHKIVNERDNNGNLPLFLAIFANHDKCVFLLVDAGADLTQKHGKDESTVLHSAIVANNSNILNGLFKHDKTCMDNIKEFTVTTKHLEGATALHMAVFTDSLKCVKILVKNKCKLEAKTKYGDRWYTACELATIKGHDEVLKELLKENDVLVNTPDTMGMMPIHWACIHHHRKAIKVIVDAGCDLSAKCVHKGGESKSTAMDLFINRVPGAVDSLEEILDSAITVSKEHIEFDYKILLPKVKGDSKQRLKVIDALVQTGDQVNQERLFTHPVIETFLCLQWERIRTFYLWSIFVFTFFLVIPFHILLMGVYYREHSLSDFTFWALCASMGLCCIGYIIHEVLYISFKTRNSRYFCHWQLSKEVCIFIFQSVYSILKLGLISILLFLSFTSPQEKYFREIATCTSILLCLQLTLFISRVPIYGIYMQMFFKVTTNFFVIMVAFSIIFFGFVTTFVVEYRGAAPFNSIPEAFLKSLVMMTLEFEYASLFDGIKKDDVALQFSKIVFLIFVLIVGIVIMNIVLAKAFMEVKKVDRLRYQAEFLSTYEQILLFYKARIRCCSNTTTTATTTATTATTASTSTPTTATTNTTTATTTATTSCTIASTCTPTTSTTTATTSTPTTTTGTTTATTSTTNSTTSTTTATTPTPATNSAPIAPTTTTTIAPTTTTTTTTTSTTTSTTTNSMEPTATSTKLYIRFDEANRFHNTLMQSIMKRVYIVNKCRQEVPKKDELTKNEVPKENELTKKEVPEKDELTKINIQLEGIMDTNKMMMESIHSLAKKLDGYTQQVDRNTEKINQLYSSMDNTHNK